MHASTQAGVTDALTAYLGPYLPITPVYTPLSAGSGVALAASVTFPPNNQLAKSVGWPNQRMFTLSLCTMNLFDRAAGAGLRAAEAQRAMSMKSTCSSGQQSAGLAVACRSVLTVQSGVPSGELLHGSGSRPGATA